MDRGIIELKARELQAQIWRERTKLFPMGAPTPLGMLEPENAAEVLGISYQLSEGLGTWGQGCDRFEIAGMLDRQRQIIAVSTKFEYPTMRFTGAHEVGHVALDHPHRIMHRDRPVFQIQGGLRGTFEQEADYFAACFLAPSRLVIEAFHMRFISVPPLPLTDAVAFHLCGESCHALMRAGPESMMFAAAVAGAKSFNGRHFKSLAEIFGISVSAMAIRLRELKLIED
jgi:Zn-dependent peptidase ImmA (M78 family)